MRPLLIVALVAAPAFSGSPQSTTLRGSSARDLIGVHGAWGAFRDPGRCYAIARPELAATPRSGTSRGPQAVGRARWRPFASVGTFPARGQRNSLHVRLSRARDRSGRVTLSVGERRFALTANGTDAWGPDAATERAIVGAMRSGRSMSVEAVAAGGRPFADTYRLDGAATAIDAAALACVGRR